MVSFAMVAFLPDCATGPRGRHERDSVWCRIGGLLSRSGRLRRVGLPVGGLVGGASVAVASAAGSAPRCRQPRLSRRCPPRRRLAGTTPEDRRVLLGLRLQGAREPGGLGERGVEQEDGVLSDAMSAPASLARRTSRDSRSAILAISAAVERLAVEHATLDDER